MKQKDAYEKRPKYRVIGNVYNGKVYHSFAIGTVGIITDKVAGSCLLYSKQYENTDTPCQLIRCEDLEKVD